MGQLRTAVRTVTARLRRRSSSFIGVAAVSAVVLVACVARGPERSEDPRPRPDDAVTVGSFNFSESVLLAEIYAQALEGAGLPVKREFGVGNREFVEPALEQGLIDVVPEYLGTALAFLEPGAAGAVPDAPTAHRRLSEILAQRGMRALAYAPAENQNGVVVTPKTAQQYGLRSVSDLGPVAPNLTFGGPPECPQRPFCLLGLQNTYGLRFREFLPLDSGGVHTRTALEEGQVDAGLLFTTDGHLAGGEFVLLHDDRRLQPSENVVPVVRTEVIERHGERLVRRLEAVSRALTTAELAGLNRLVDIERQSPAAVAGEWLRRHGLSARPPG